MNSLNFKFSRIYFRFHYISLLFLPLPFRSNGEGTVFTGVCLFTFRGRGRVPHLADQGGGYPHLANGGGGTAIQLIRGTPSSWQWYPHLADQGGGYPHLANGGGGTAIQLIRGTPSSWQWYPHLANGRVPPSGWWEGVTKGTPSGLDAPIKTGWGYPIDIGLEYPYPSLQSGLDGVPPVRTGWGTPSPVRRQSSKASTCYAVGGMPLAFTQEDFLVSCCSLSSGTSK